MSKVPQFSRAARWLHWSMALLLLSLLFAGLTMVRALEPWQLTLLQLHKSFGLVALVLVLIRLWVRMRTQAPALPADLAAWQRVSARLSHIGLYACMLAMPVSGYLMQNAAGRPLEVFGVLTLPALLEVDLAVYGMLREVHGWVALAFIVLILVHVAAALQHGLIRRDGVLQTMTGRRRP
ncbi:cytochrome B561 [Pseudidiomarina atlantica]|uniref:Cytochrome B561 n=1 Tax=Pseudidiomarina atlantica TaxID=1517416 RepID=A0A094JA63_9GAMM|nr:cytochrome b [Pseudidiomarina atlantica]KFZ29471.1 cytochrome B561 [Pseudidiomarina atlantica]